MDYSTAVSGGLGLLVGLITLVCMPSPFSSFNDEHTSLFFESRAFLRAVTWTISYNHGLGFRRPFCY